MGPAPIGALISSPTGSPQIPKITMVPLGFEIYQMFSKHIMLSYLFKYPFNVLSNVTFKGTFKVTF